jgi:intracellular sulfur oxidation DsrE/DsrF family protein
MSFTRRTVLQFAASLMLLSGATTAIAADDGVKRLAIQVSDNDPATFTKALNVATNFAKGMSDAGEIYEIEIVTFNAGLHLLRTDTSPVMDRIKSISESVPDVTFSACGNTIAGMTKKEGAAPPVTEYARVVPAGVVRLMELDEMGYYVIRP